MLTNLYKYIHTYNDLPLNWNLTDFIQCEELRKTEELSTHYNIQQGYFHGILKIKINNFWCKKQHIYCNRNIGELSNAIYRTWPDFYLLIIYNTLIGHQCTMLKFYRLCYYESYCDQFVKVLHYCVVGWTCFNLKPKFWWF